LPVHRLPGARGGVYAYTLELTEWMERPSSTRPENHEPLETQTVTDPKSDPTPVNTTELERAVAVDASVPHDPPSPQKHKVVVALIAVFVLVALATATIVAVKHRRVDASARLRNRATIDPTVYDLYLKGRYHWDKRTPEDLNKAVDYFNQAIAKDPNYAAAYVGLADTYNLLREYTPMRDSEAYPRALAAARKAIELDPSSAEAHKSLAFGTFYWEWDATAAEREFRRAIELDPNCAVAHHWYATFLLTAGRSNEGLLEIERARQLDPGSTSIVADKGWILYGTGAKQEALALLKQVEESAPDAVSSHRYLAWIYLDEQDYPHYFVEEKRVGLLTHNADELAIVKAAETGFAAGGRSRMLQSMLAAEEALYRKGHLSPYELATTLAQLGRSHEALTYLQTAFRNHYPGLIDLRADTRLNGLHDEPAYRELVARVGLPPMA
jgi:Tfp pilus assembly protein PilF